MCVTFLLKPKLEFILEDSFVLTAVLHSTATDIHVLLGTKEPNIKEQLNQVAKSCMIMWTASEIIALRIC